MSTYLEALTRILNTFVQSSPLVKYGQGMNYLSGLLYFQLRDEEKTCKTLISIVERNSMSQLFDSQAPLLRQFFYQLDSLIGQNLPDLHSHFNVTFFVNSIFLERGNQF